MQLNLPQYEMRDSTGNDWVPISEKSTLQSLFNTSMCVSTMIEELLKGKEITCRDSIFRIRNFKLL